MTNKTDAPSCSERVFTTGDPWGGHPCSRKGVVERDGKFWCKVHDPERVSARAAQREAEYQAKLAEEDRLRATSQKLIEQLGAGSLHYSAFSHKLTGGVVLTEREATALVERLRQAEDFMIRTLPAEGE